MSVTVVAVCIMQYMCLALELVTGLCAVLALLLAEKSQYLVQSILPQFAEDAVVSCQEPVLVGQTPGKPDASFNPSKEPAPTTLYCGASS